ncbi:hypothetical protein DXG01_008940 [Tephrocybe rancida]|nr:hypothetical protein DXG01_008940 [Tephrocybe rancida]
MRYSTLFNLHVDETDSLVTKPRFSWNTTSHDTQASYRIQVSGSRDGCHNVWDSGIIPSSTSLVEYAGPSLSPGAHYFWTVNVGMAAGQGFIATSEFTTNYSPFQDTSHELGRRQATIDFGTLTTAFKTGTWIWTADGAPPLFLAPPGDRFFRRTYTPPAGKTAVLAEVIITADNTFSLFVNGMLVGVPPAAADSWENAQGYKMVLNPGPVVFAVAATNAPSAIGGANAAGLLVAIRITHSDATQVLIGTDRTWLSNILPVPAFQLPATDDSKWVPATPLAKFGEGPWALVVTLPTVLATVTLPAPTTSLSSILPSSTSSTPPTTSTTPLPSTTSSPPPTTSSSTQTITQTSFTTEEPTAPAASTAPASSATSSTKPALIGAILGGVLGAFALLGLILVFWRRRKRAQDELAAADFDTWIPAPHAASGGAASSSNANAPFMSQTPGRSGSPALSSNLRQPQYGNNDQYAQPQAPYRYPPPSAIMGGAASAGQYGGGYGAGAADYGRDNGGYAAAGGGYGGAPVGGAYDTQAGRYGDGYGQSGYAANQDYGSSAQLVPAQQVGSGGNVPQTLVPGGAPGYHTSAGAGQNTNPSYDHKYY